MILQCFAIIFFFSVPTKELATIDKGAVHCLSSDCGSGWLNQKINTDGCTDCAPTSHTVDGILCRLDFWNHHYTSSSFSTAFPTFYCDFPFDLWKNSSVSMILKPSVKWKRPKLDWRCSHSDSQTVPPDEVFLNKISISCVLISWHLTWMGKWFEDFPVHRSFRKSSLIVG